MDGGFSGNARLTIDFQFAGNATVQLVSLTIDDDVLGPVWANDVVLPIGAQHAIVGHQQNAVDQRVSAVTAEEIQTRGRTERMRLAKTQMD